jgi:hypothetical protein
MIIYKMNCFIYIISIATCKSNLYSVETLTGIKFITWTCVIFVKNPKIGRFLFAHILAHMVFAHLLEEVRNHLKLFFQIEGYAK